MFDLIFNKQQQLFTVQLVVAQMFMLLTFFAKQQKHFYHL